MATTVSLDQLAEQDLLLPSQGHPLRRELDANFKMAGTPLPSVEEEDALDLRLTKVAQFLGPRLLPSPLYQLNYRPAANYSAFPRPYSVPKAS